MSFGVGASTFRLGFWGGTCGFGSYVLSFLVGACVGLHLATSGFRFGLGVYLDAVQFRFLFGGGVWGWGSSDFG